MNDLKVIMVVLRQPNMKPDEMRSDPFWEFGSFGCTGCHKTNLMNPKKLHKLTGAQIAFAQGGPLGFKLVYVTPPVFPTLYQHTDGLTGELTWQADDEYKMPFKYSTAPLLINNQGQTDFPLLKSFLADAKSPTPVSKFSSLFRSRRRPLESDFAQQICEVFSNRLQCSNMVDLAEHYWQALPFGPPCKDQNRRTTLDNFRVG